MLTAAGYRLAQNREDVGLTEDEQLLTINRDFGAAILPVKDLVADLHVHRHALVLLEPTRSNGDDLTLLRLFLRRVGDIHSAAHRFGFFQRPNDNAIGQWADLHTGLGGHTVCASCLWLL